MTRQVEFFDRKGVRREATYIANLVDEPNLRFADGSVPGITAINKFGANLIIAGDTREDIWDGGGDYPYSTTADVTHIHQDIDQIALRGATIEAQGLDVNWETITQTIVLDANDTTVLVPLGTPLIRIFRMKILANVVGDSSVHAVNAAHTIVYASMEAGNNQTLMALYTVPAGKTAYMTNYYASQTDAANKSPVSTAITLWTADRANQYEFQLKHAIGVPNQGNMTNHIFMPYIKINEKNDIKMSAKPVGDDANVAAGFDLILVNNR